MSRGIGRMALKIIPWLVTAGALYVAFRGVDLSDVWQHLARAHRGWLVLAVACTTASYLMRARRWQFLFPGKETALGYLHSYRVMILGFFMNNVLPARAGELVRAHMGAIVTKQKRTLVLATIAAERLADGLMLSSLFVLGALGLARGALGNNLLLVAGAFVLVAVAVVGVLVFRKCIFQLLEKLTNKSSHPGAHYVLHRVQVFIEGLAPLCSLRRFPLLFLWTLGVWLIELLVFYFTSHAFGADLSISGCILFMAVVNFSSLIPAAPGGIGVIEAIATGALVSLGIDKEQGLSMVLTQHLIQYLVVGFPGALVMLTWREFSRSREHMLEIDDPSPSASTQDSGVVN